MIRKHTFIRLDDKLAHNGARLLEEDDDFSDRYIAALAGCLGESMDPSFLRKLQNEYFQHLMQDDQVRLMVGLVRGLGKSFFSWHAAQKREKTKNGIIEAFAVLVVMLIAPIAMRSILTSLKRMRGVPSEVKQMAKEGIRHHTSIIRRAATLLSRSKIKMDKVAAFTERRKRQWE